MTGIVSYGAYVPYWRLPRSAIGDALGSGGGRGTRSVASFDEDTTSMGVEAARLALRSAPEGYEPRSVWFSTTTPAYLDKTNANAVHAALALPPAVPTVDVIGSVRSGLGAAFAARAGRGLAVLSDIRTGRPGSADETGGGDAAVVFAFGDGPGVIAEEVSSATSTAEFLDRWRLPGDPFSRQWEERFGEYAYLPLVEEAVTDAYKAAGLAAADIDHVVLTGTHPRSVKAAAKTVGARPETYADDLSTVIGNPGSAQWGLVFADVLDRAQPNQTIALVTLADGCHVEIWRTTAAIADRRPAPNVQDQIATTREDLSYSLFLTWRGYLDREPPRRPEPDRPAAPPAFRTTEWKYGFFGSRDESGFIYLPPARVSIATGSVDQMTPVRMADVQATIATFTVDRLAYSLSPPVVAAVIDFDGGGRFQCELTDVDPGAVKIGDRVEMTFRRLFTAEGVHNYFWKARPIRAEGAQGGQ
jgi:3-hydroxy-3-methylglutaryl CoA synthase